MGLWRQAKETPMAPERKYRQSWFLISQCLVPGQLVLPALEVYGTSRHPGIQRTSPLHSAGVSRQVLCLNHCQKEILRSNELAQVIKGRQESTHPTGYRAGTLLQGQERDPSALGSTQSGGASEVTGQRGAAGWRK